MVSVERGLKVRRSEVEAVTEVVQPLPMSPQTPALFSCKGPPKCFLFQEPAPGSPSGSWIPLCLCAGEPEAPGDLCLPRGSPHPVPDRCGATNTPAPSLLIWTL